MEPQVLAILLLFAMMGALLLGFPIAATLSGVSILFGVIAYVMGLMDIKLLSLSFNRIFGLMNNQVLLSIPFFILMGALMQRANLAGLLLKHLSQVIFFVPNNLAISVILVGAMMSASTGIVGATIVALAMMSVKPLLDANYSPDRVAGLIASTGTLGQLIPPSILLILLADVLSNANQLAQQEMGIFFGSTLSVKDLFVGSMLPSVFLVSGYIAIQFLFRSSKIQSTSISTPNFRQWCFSLFALMPILGLILSVLGCILFGITSPTEASVIGVLVAMILAFYYRKMTTDIFRQCVDETVLSVGMIFFILIGASIFSLVFKSLGGDEVIQAFLTQLPGGQVGAVFFVMLILFCLGFILDYIEILFVIVPIIAPPLIILGVDPLLLGIMIAINLQTSFLTPPFGFSLFYLRGAISKAVIPTLSMYKGVIPFIIWQLILLVLLYCQPAWFGLKS